MYNYIENLNIGDIYHNSNGEDYLVIGFNKPKDKLFLLSPANTYIVAWGVGEKGWCQGHYFMSDLKGAMEYLFG